MSEPYQRDLPTMILVLQSFIPQSYTEARADLEKIFQSPLFAAPEMQRHFFDQVQVLLGSFIPTPVDGNSPVWAQAILAVWAGTKFEEINASGNLAETQRRHEQAIASDTVIPFTVIKAGESPFSEGVRRMLEERKDKTLSSPPAKPELPTMDDADAVTLFAHGEKDGEGWILESWLQQEFAAEAAADESAFTGKSWRIGDPESGGAMITLRQADQGGQTWTATLDDEHYFPVDLHCRVQVRVLVYLCQKL